MSGVTAKKDASESKTYPNPPYKIIILDEADAITPDAQSALRRVIEAYSKITRFILICNYVTRIITPLTSRCAKFRFQLLPPASMMERLQTIARAESCKFKNEQDEIEVLNKIMTLSHGDMRRAITTLQSAHALAFGSKSTDHNEGLLTAENVEEIYGIPPQRTIQKLLQGLKGSTYSSMENAVLEIVNEGYPATTILSALFNELVMGDAVENEKKRGYFDDADRAAFSVKMAEVDKCLVDGADDVLQLLSLCSFASKCLARKK